MSKTYIIAGGRDCSDRKLMYSALQDLLCTKGDYCMPRDNVKVIHGGAKGADSMADDWFVVSWCPFDVFPADWDQHGKRAGIMRNLDMADAADALIAFWDGESRGTKHMIETAIKEGLEVHVYRY